MPESVLTRRIKFSANTPARPASGAQARLFDQSHLFHYRGSLKISDLHANIVASIPLYDKSRGLPVTQSEPAIAGNDRDPSDKLRRGAVPSIRPAQ